MAAGPQLEHSGMAHVSSSLSTARPPAASQHLLEAVVLFAVGAVPAVAIPVGHQCIVVAEPAVDHSMRWLHPVDQGQQSWPGRPR